MRREFHVRFCEGVGVRLPRATRLILCFQYKEDAERVLEVLRKRFAKYGLTLHPEKTRLIEFGRSAVGKAERPGGKPPETFDFLGFTHIATRNRRGSFTIHVKTMRKRLKRSLKAVAYWSVRGEGHQRDVLPAAALTGILLRSARTSPW